jgi:hypothetical protein
MFGLEPVTMPDEIERRIREELLGLAGDGACEDLESVLEALKERDRRISETLEELLQEVDDLILLADEIEENEALCDEEL